jgi:hypothetical protein
MSNNIEKAYDNLIKAADQMVFEDDVELTDEQIDQMIDAMGSEITDPAQLFPSNNGHAINENTDPEQNVEAKVLVSANPATGVLSTIPYKEDEITEESLDKLLDLKPEELGNVELNWDIFVETTQSMYPGADEESLKHLFDLAERYRKKEEFAYFRELPEFIKKEINTLVDISALENQGTANETKRLKNMLAKELFDTIITNNYSSKAFADISKFTTNEINKEKEKLGGSIHEYNSKLREEYEVGFIKKAEELESSGEEGATETAQKLRDASRMFTQSYTYEDMYEAYKTGKIKVKNIQIEKLNRTFSEFNRKYYNNTFKIHDVGMVMPVLDRVLDQKYNINAVKKFVVAFINYTKNFRPENIHEHVFMYYFIQNILALDVKVPENTQIEFNDLLIENINKFLDLIIEKDNLKEELKKGNKK